MNLVYDEEKKVWHEPEEPYTVIEVPTKTAFDKLQKCVNKQNRKKVRFEDTGYDQFHDVNVYAAICPSCGLALAEWDDSQVEAGSTSDNPEKMWHENFVHHNYEGRDSYCNRCGQKLDWGRY